MGKGNKDNQASLGTNVEPYSNVQFLRPLLKIGILIAVGVVLTTVIRLTFLGDYLQDVHRIQDLLDRDNVFDELIFVLLVTLFICIGAPRLVFYGLGGMIFGFWEGLLLAQIGTLAGALVMFLSVRWAGQEWVSNWLSRYPTANKVIQIKSSVFPVMMARQLPIGGVVINIAMGLSSLKVFPFLIGSFLGFLPLGIVITLIGSGIVENTGLESATKLIGALVVGVISVLWFSHKKFRIFKFGISRGVFFWVLAITSTIFVFYIIRLSGPSDLEGYAQNRTVGYVMDAAWEGDWIVQHDVQNRITSKPPLHTWITAVLGLAYGINRITLTLPSFLSLLALALILFAVGYRNFGLTAGGFSGLAAAMTPAIIRHTAMVRTDPLFALFVTLVSLSAWKAWSQRRGWILFWTAATIATLIKGPLGLILGSCGLLAYFWEKRSNERVIKPKLCFLPGLGIYLVFCMGWFLLALKASGHELIDKIIFDELIGQATGVGKKIFPGQNFYKPVLHMISYFLPFSIFAYMGVWRSIKNPAKEQSERLFERFLVCWLVAGMAIFSFSAHYRADLLLPIWPAGALLAGREIARFKKQAGNRKLICFVIISYLMLTGYAFFSYRYIVGRRKELAQENKRVEQAAKDILALGYDPENLQHFCTPVTFQLHLGTYKSWSDLNELQKRVDNQKSLLIATSLKDHELIYSQIKNAEIEEVYRWSSAERLLNNDFTMTVLKVTRKE